jgi:hypothetical protein
VPCFEGRARNICYIKIFISSRINLNFSIADRFPNSLNRFVFLSFGLQAYNRLKTITIEKSYFCSHNILLIFSIKTLFFHRCYSLVDALQRSRYKTVGTKLSPLVAVFLTQNQFQIKPITQIASACVTSCIYSSVSISSGFFFFDFYYFCMSFRAVRCHFVIITKPKY